jgi:hypothetical protein
MFGSSLDAIVAAHGTARFPDRKFGFEPELAASPHSRTSSRVFAPELHMDPPQAQTQM